MEVATCQDIRKGILQMEQKVASHPEAFFGDTDNCPLFHHFADGCYVREIHIPAGTLVVGKIHRHKHPNFLLKGSVVVVTEEGRKTLHAPVAMISPAATKRVVFALTDTIWMTVHVTEKTDLDEIENDIIAPSYEAIGVDDPLVKEALQCLG